ncbi:hypothetical protein JIN84_00005 [Luteolibacter yonseiensis]|uniref:Uncharacterized protein n=1 Tax=Luteolibacter yonseiensis TaxID=1144680 RepID=A0A934QZL6_9BACT|nr:hypothetical protein [Luteolibacter yonseiensis]MBK1813989.1 hypothetical protein [Luteolibacter yonseiensis]
MKAIAIAARFKRTLTGAFSSAPRETPVPAPDTTDRHSAREALRQKAVAPSAEELESGGGYFIPAATSPSDAWQIINEHRAHLAAAIAAGLFVTRIR